MMDQKKFKKMRLGTDELWGTKFSSNIMSNKSSVKGGVAQNNSITEIRNT